MAFYLCPSGNCSFLTVAKDDVDFCPDCGKQLVKQLVKQCPKCNTQIEKDSQHFCMKCGTKLKEEKQFVF